MKASSDEDLYWWKLLVMKTSTDEDLYWSRPLVIKTSSDEDLYEDGMKTSTYEDL